MRVIKDEKNTGKLTFWHKYEESANSHEDRTNRAELKPHDISNVVLELEDSYQNFLRMRSKQNDVEKYIIENSRLIAYIKRYGQKVQ